MVFRATLRAVVIFSSLVVLLANPTRALPGFSTHEKVQVIEKNHPNIFYHGRWDATTGSWWAGTGLKLSVKNLKTLSVTLGVNSSAPSAPAAVSFDNGPFFTVDLVAGDNAIAVPDFHASAGNGNEATDRRRKTTLVRINVQGWQRNRIQVQDIRLNADAKLLPYKPARRAFQFIGDSLSAGQFLPLGVNQAWPFLVGEHFKAEHRINAQPGATLTDMESYGNVHGISYQYFRTEDTGFVWTSDHNFTTAWDFKKDTPRATHVVVHVGANDASHGVTNDAFVEVYTDFLVKLRKLNPGRPIFVFTPWGWPNADGNTYYYYQGQYERIVKVRHEEGDTNVHLVDTTGWVSWNDVYEDNVHPNEEGHANIAKKFVVWLDEWEKGNSR